MARLPREPLKTFGGSGGSSNFGQFGSQAASAPVETKDIATIQALSAWIDGWQDAVALGQAPYLQDMNSAFYVHSYELVYLLQEGAPEWDSATTYNYGSIVKSLHGGGTDTYLYLSLSDSNLNHALPSGAASNASWTFLYGLTGSGLVIPGNVAGTDAPAGTIGETDKATQAAACGTTNVWTDLTTLSLEAGVYLVNAQTVFNVNGAVMTGDFSMAVSQYSGATITDHVLSDNVLASLYAASPALETSMTVAGWQLNLSGPATLYLKTKALYSGGAPSVTGTVRVLRIH